MRSVLSSHAAALSAILLFSCSGKSNAPMPTGTGDDAGTDSPDTATGGSGGQGGNHPDTGGSGGDAGGGDGGAGGQAGGGDGGAGGQAGGGDAGMGGTAGGGSGGGKSDLVGREFWAVDLPNERGPGATAASAAWGLVLSNVSSAAANIVIEKSDGQAQLTVSTLSLAPGESGTVTMPRAEVTGWTPSTQDPPGPPMTWQSLSAFRITSSADVAAVQLNTLDDQGSNDATALLPRISLGVQHRVIGFPAANPLAIPGMPFAGIPDHSSVTIVGILPTTTVTVTPSSRMLGDGASVEPLEPGVERSFVLEPFMVLNLATDGTPGDLTGTKVESDRPIAVFSSAERIIVPGSDSGAPQPPPGFSSNCCTDHFEQQIPPNPFGGTVYAVARSPLRSSGAYREPDLLRVMSLYGGTSVTTSLAGADAAFSLTAGEFRDVWTTTDVIIQADYPLHVAQILVSKAYTTAEIGDPTLTLIPPVYAHRSKHIFAVPPQAANSYIAMASPENNDIELDSEPLPFTCIRSTIGAISGITYEAIRCPIAHGEHRLQSSKPLGAVVYGYSTGSSYAFALSGI